VDTIKKLDLTPHNTDVASWTFKSGDLTITINSNGKAEILNSNINNVATDVINGSEKVKEAANYIGTFAGIEVRIAPDVDKSHGEHALDRLKAYDITGNFPDGGRVVDRSNGVIAKIIITGAPGEMFHVKHLGGGVLEARLDLSEAGSISGILGTGSTYIENNIIGENNIISFLINLKKDKIHA
ncbi:MAG: hypothetical protein FWE09_01325, partial [Treponema sp.]|nr:hypothetical protein [Treponema sp.]